MKKKISKTLCAVGFAAILLVAGSGNVAFAQDFPHVGLFPLDGTASTGPYKGSQKDVVIPAQFYGYRLTTISDEAFKSKQLTSVIIPDTVTSIGDRAFADNRLTSVTIPNNVISIGDDAFRDNPLTSVTFAADCKFSHFSLPNLPAAYSYLCNGRKAGTYRVEEILEREAEGYRYIETLYGLAITGYTGDAKYLSIPASLNNKPVKYIEGLSDKGFTGVIIPNGVISIGPFAFSDNQLTTITLPNSVTYIGDNAFSGDYNGGGNQLTSITLPDSVTFIGSYAFAYNRLTSVTIPNSVISIDDRAFAYNRSLSAITVDPANRVYSSRDGVLYSKDGKTLLYWPAGKWSTVIPDGVISIGAEAFYNQNRTSITIPGSVTSIGSWAFSQNRLTSVTIPGSVTSIEREAFAYNQLTSVIIPNGVTSIGATAFSRNQLTSVTIPNSVTSIGSWAFSNNQLTSVTIPNSVTSIEEAAFSENEQMVDITIGANVNLVGAGSPFPGKFKQVYDRNGKKAGRYTRSGDNWTYAGEQ